MKLFFLVCAIAGTVIPYSEFVPWLMEHGLDARGFVAELFSTRIGAFFGLDVVISAIALIGFILVEGQRAKINRLWMPIAATFLVGVSCGLPLFLYMREGRAAT